MFVTPAVFYMCIEQIRMRIEKPLSASRIQNEKKNLMVWEPKHTNLKGKAHSKEHFDNFLIFGSTCLRQDLTIDPTLRQLQCQVPVLKKTPKKSTLFPI
jgi:hypothetical protein